MSFSATADAATRDGSETGFAERVDMVDLWALVGWAVDEMYRRINTPKGGLHHLTVSSPTTIDASNAPDCV
jgi:hypothetical protein